MILKFKTIQTKIKLFYLKITGKLKKSNHSIEINKNNNRKIKNILIIFPVMEESFRVALYSFRRLNKSKNINYYYIINSVYKHHFNLSGNIFNLFYNKKKIKIDKTFYQDRIINKNFDIIIDLNNEFFYDICYMLSNMNSYYKIGLDHEYSDYFYNIQLKVDILENCYKKIEKMIN